MMEFLIPSRADRPSNDPIFALNHEANARRAAGETVVNATLGALLDDDGRLAVLPTVVEAVRQVPPQQAAAYAPLAGPPSFLAAAINELLSATPLADHAIAVATPGGTGALRHAVNNFLEPGQSLLTSSYHWGPYQTIAEESGRSVATFEMFDSEGELNVPAFDVALQKQMAEQGRALVFLNDPCQNPTGYSMRAAQWQGVVESLSRAATRGPITLLSDVAYYLYGTGDPRAFLSHLQPLVGKVALAFAWTASKSFTQYGARVGALVVVDPERSRRTRIESALAFSCRGTWSNCNHGGMLAVTRLLTDATLRTQVDAERAQLKALLDGRVRAFNRAATETKLRYPRYDGGFFTTVFVPSGRDVHAVASSLRSEGIYVVPQGQALRLGLCSVAEREVPRLVEAVARAMG